MYRLLVLIFFSITTILTTILLYGTVNASMPKVSYSKALDYFLMTSLGIIFMSLLEYVLVLNTHPNLRRENEEDETASEPLTSTEKSGTSKVNSKNILFYSEFFCASYTPRLQIHYLCTKNPVFPHQSLYLCNKS